MGFRLRKQEGENGKEPGRQKRKGWMGFAGLCGREEAESGDSWKESRRLTQGSVRAVGWEGQELLAFLEKLSAFCGHPTQLVWLKNWGFTLVFTSAIGYYLRLGEKKVPQAIL